MRQPDFGAPIVSPNEFAELRPTLGTVVTTSGGFDPIHPGHARACGSAS